jgi:polysaccharide biosynthesis protein PslH
MNLLFLCHRLPYPPQRGGKIRPFNMIRHLARSHRVTVATLARGQRELTEGQPLREHCHELHIGVIPPAAGWSRFATRSVTPTPSTFAYFHSPSLRRAVGQLLARERFDAIVVHCSSMGPYVGHYRGCRKVMDFGDADSEKWLEYARRKPFPASLGFWLEGMKVRRAERRLGEQFDACSVISSRERSVLERFVAKPIEVIPNGVDLEYFRPSGNDGNGYRPRRLVFTGNMSYGPNVEAVRHLVAEILPRIERELPGVELYVVGMDPAREVRRLADGQRVIVTGRVDDVRPYLQSAAAAVAPLRVARGLQNKVLEAMAMRVPVIASPAARAGIDAIPGRDLVVADDAGTFSDAVVSVLRDATKRQRYADAGRAYVTANHNWDRVLRRLDDLVAGGAGGAVSRLPTGASPRTR